MVKSITTVVVSEPAPARADAPPGEDEMVAIAAAVQAYILAGEEELRQHLYMQELATKSGAESFGGQSPWAVASRLEGTRSSAPLSGAMDRPQPAKKLWRNFLGALLLATGLGISQASHCLPASAQGAGYGVSSDLASTGVSSQAFYGSWSFADKTQTVRVMLGVPSQKIDLDLPDGGSIYTADGNLVARVGPRSSWTLNLATAGPAVQRWSSGMSGITPKRKLVFSGKTNLDVAQSQVSNQNLGPGNYQKAAYTPSGGARFSENRFALPSAELNGGYLVVPEADSSAGAPPVVGVNGKLYRGCLLLRPTGSIDPVLPGASTGAVSAPNDASFKTAVTAPATSAIAAINVVKIEDYLLSVVPSEVPASWPQEVLKAQAITARSYVVANLGKHKADGYDVKDSVEDQVYKGVMSENNETNVACANTTGLVLKQNAQVISAFFHSTSGGSTELAENVWSKPLPYLKSVPDYDDASPYATWERTFTTAQLNKALGFNLDAGEELTGLFVVSRYKSEAQRVRHLVAASTGSGRLLTGGEMRKILGLPSTQFNIVQTDGSYVFRGKGFGHGLGLSQWGAKALADKGYNAGQILSYYYKDITIESMGQFGGASGSI